MPKTHKKSKFGPNIAKKIHDQLIATGITWSILAALSTLAPITFYFYSSNSLKITHSEEILYLGYVLLVVGYALFLCGKSSRWRMTYWLTSSIFVSLSFVCAACVVTLNWNQSSSAEKVLIIGLLVMMMSWYSDIRLAVVSALPIAVMYTFIFSNTPFENEFDRVITLIKFPIIFSGFMITIRRFILVSDRMHAKEIYTINRLQKASLIDELTRTVNRRGFNEGLDGAIRTAKRFDLSLSLAIIDIDFFKQYNDEFGHPAGDRCLKRVASIIKSQCNRSVDVVSRTGGEEFALILPGTTRKQAVLLLERVQKAMANARIEHPDSKVSKYVTISCGVAEYQGESKDELYSNADKAMYQAKRGGRNRIYST